MSPPFWLYWPAAAVGGTVVASGGTETDVGGYRYHIFTSSGTLQVTTGGEVEMLLVAGGGGGGRQSDSGGGGGAGGVLLLDGVNALTVASSTNYTVTVGNGGAGGSGNNKGASGGNSSLVGGALSETAIGGEGGQGNFATMTSGGSGGGGQGNEPDFGLGTPGQGNNGARGSSSTTPLSGGGGGGASQTGTAGATGAGGKGGDGLSIWGTLGGNAPGSYGGGGGGTTGANGGGGSGGIGGGGNGQGGTVPSTAGAANTGGGGGAGATARAGGSGIVIVRYPLSAAVLWTPNALADLRCWLDASDSATITLSGSSVTLWEDKAGTNDADDALSAGGSKITTARPTIVAAAQNSLDAIGFNGSQWFDHNSARAMLQDRSCAIMAVAMKYGSVTTGSFQFAWTNRKGTASGDLAVRFQLIHYNTNAFAADSRRLDSDSGPGSITVSTAPPYDTNWHVHVALLDWTNGSMEYRIDGTLIGTASYASSGNTSNTDLGTASGTWTAIGNTSRSASNNNQLSSGSRIGEMICWAKSSGSYTAAEVQDVEGYLAHKWGLEGNLPVGHPYKAEPPYIT